MAAPVVSAVRVAANPTGKGWRLGIVGKRTWSVVRKRCVLASQQVPLVVEPLYDEARAVLVHDTDLLLNRTRTDIIVEGHVYPPDGRTPYDFGLQVGATQRLARANGPRRVTQATTGGLRFSAPELVDRIPLSWESAYGGVDLAARADIGDPFEKMQQEIGIVPDPRFGLFAYPRNPVGTGYVIEPTPQAIEACALPLIEDPESLVTPGNLVRGDVVRWPQGPVVAGFGWLSYGFFPRSALMGAPPLVYDGANIPPSAFFEVRRGELLEASVRGDRPPAERLGLAVAQSAAIGLRAAAVNPGDGVALHGMHPREPRWTFTIPTETPRMGVRFAGEKAFELPRANIRTLFIQPDVDRITLVWTAELELPAQPGPNRLKGIEHVVLWKD